MTNRGFHVVQEVIVIEVLKAFPTTSQRMCAMSA